VNALTLGLLAYVGLQLCIGVFAARRVATEQDYLLAGRTLGPLMATASVFATWFGAEACVGAAGQAYREGLSPMSVEPFAYGLALVAVGLVLAAPLWRAGVTTFPDYLRRRFSPAVERFAAILHIPGSLLWAAAQVRAFGQVLSATAGIDLELAVTIAAGVAIVYTAMGGLLADVVTDLMQGGVLVVGLLVVTIAVIAEAGGVSGALETAAQRTPTHEGPGALATAEAWLIPIGGSLVSQEVLARAMAARSPNVARGSVVAGGVAYVLAGSMPLVIGLVGAGMVPGLDDGEQIMPVIARDHLHPIVYVMFAGALISAILSTIDSALLVAGSLLSRNVLHAGRDDVPDATRLRTARLSVIGFGLLAWLLAFRSDSVFSLVEQASGFGSAGMVVVLLVGLFGRTGGPRAALATLGTGVAAWVVLRYVITDFPYPWLVGLLASVVAWFSVRALERVR
jgi:SSS family transporter